MCLNCKQTNLGWKGPLEVSYYSLPLKTGQTLKFIGLFRQSFVELKASIINFLSCHLLLDLQSEKVWEVVIATLKV